MDDDCGKRQIFHSKRIIKVIMDTRLAKNNVQLREIIDRALSQLNTGLPGKIISFDPSTRTCKVQPGIQMKTTIRGLVSFESLPVIRNVPVEMPTCVVAGFYITLPIRAEDPCWIKFSQRAIDHWFENGGVQPPGDNDAVGCRHHDLTDAIVSFAPATLNDVLDNYEEDGIEIRNKAKTSRITVKDDVVEIAVGTCLFTVSNDGKIVAKAGDMTFTVASDGSAEITIGSSSFLVSSDGTMTATGDLEVTGALSSDTSVADPIGTLAALRTAFNAHTHQYAPGPGSPTPTGPPVPTDPAA